MWPFSAYPERSLSEIDGKAYDYIIVGGGTAGCVLASRLSEDPNVSVLVLEKGRVKYNTVSRMPLMSQNFWLFDTLQVQSTRWTEPIPEAYGRKIRLWGTEGIGGSSRINALLWTRGPPGGYAAWSQMGLDDWGWDQVEPYFRKMENAVSHPDSSSRGHGGPVEMQQLVAPFKWRPYLQKAARETGLPVLKDCNIPEAPAMGYFDLDTTIDRHRERVSAFTAFLGKDVALKRRNHLTVCTGVIASRLELDVTKNIVRGVHVRSSTRQDQGSDPTKDCFVKANREVIICSGAICSPQLLLLSGIGPKDSAKALDIPLVKELPAVGTAFSDHYSFPIMLEMPKNETLHLLESIWGLWHILLWFFFRLGLMGMTSAPSAIWFRSGAVDQKTMDIKQQDDDGSDNMDASEPRNIPDVEIMLMPINGLERHVPGRSIFDFYPTIIKPHGTGRIELSSIDPLANPRITYSMFDDERDLKVARIAVRFTMRLAQEFQNSGYPYPAPFLFAPGNRPEVLSEWEKSAGSEAGTHITAQKENAENTAAHAQESQEGKTWKTVTDDEIDDYIRRVAHTSLHYSCTCPMSNDERAGVVDQKLRVHGFKNLRIADTSVFPKIPSGHTMAPVMMVAERCADFIKDAWRDADANANA